jgi:hypothetical protein
LGAGVAATGADGRAGAGFEAGAAATGFGASLADDFFRLRASAKPVLPAALLGRLGPTSSTGNSFRPFWAMSRAVWQDDSIHKAAMQQTNGTNRKLSAKKRASGEAVLFIRSKTAIRVTEWEKKPGKPVFLSKITDEPGFWFRLLFHPIPTGGFHRL